MFLEKIQKIMRYLYWSIIPILLVTIGLAIAFYPEPYKFFQEFLSDLGGVNSIKNSFVNKTSSIIFSIGFSLCAAIGATLAILYFIKDLRYKYLKGILCIFITIGAALTCVPHDLGNTLILHTVGACIFIGAFGILNFVLQMLRFIQKHQKVPEKRKIDFYSDLSIVVLVFIVVLTLVTVFIPFAINENPTFELLSIIFQKLVIIVDCLALIVLDLDDI